MSDYDHVDGDHVPECTCRCDGCRNGMHYKCSAAMLCPIAERPEDCPVCGRERCVCDDADTPDEPVEFKTWGPAQRGRTPIEQLRELRELVDASPLDLSTIESIVNRMKGLEL